MKSRIYQFEYWFGTTKIEQQMPFKNYVAAFHYIYSRGLKPLNVHFVGWQKGWK